jgi:predicted RNA binding protein YcfA (HicA-like mRNA interferase family)
MKIPRTISGEKLSRLLHRFGFEITRQTGSHMRLTTIIKGEFHITIPNHKTLKIGTINNILSDIADYLEIDKKKLMKAFFD